MLGAAGGLGAVGTGTEEVAFEVTPEGRSRQGAGRLEVHSDGDKFGALGLA